VDFNPNVHSGGLANALSKEVLPILNNVSGMVQNVFNLLGVKTSYMVESFDCLSDFNTSLYRCLALKRMSSDAQMAAETALRLSKKFKEKVLVRLMKRFNKNRKL
jgi:hypothetical protein